jgi:hypothetical protein
MRKSKVVSYTNRFQQKYQALKYRWMSISAASNFCAMVNVCEECLIKRIIITDSWAAAASYQHLTVTADWRRALTSPMPPR